MIPIGLVQQAQVNQSKQVNEIFEVGSRVPFFIPGRHGVRASLSRVLFDGPSLFYALYRGGYSGSSIAPNFTGAGSNDTPTSPYSGEVTFNSSSQTVNNTDEQIIGNSEEFGRFWSNLGSTIFNRPIGLGIILYDMEGQPYGGSYLEHCLIQTHNFGISANQTVLAESVSLSARRVIPINAANLTNVGNTAV